MKPIPKLEFIEISVIEDHIAVVTLNRPPVNAFTPQMYHEVKAAFEFTDDPENGLRCVILNAKGKMFSAGNDISIFSDDTVYQNPNYSSIVDEAGNAVLFSKLPVVCSVNGACVGTGFCLAAVSDVVIASKKGRFGITELNIGVIGGAPEASYCLPPKVTRYMSLTGNLLSAEEMYRHGMVIKVVEEDQLEEETLAIARDIAKHDPLGLRYARQVILKVYDPVQLGEKVDYSSELNREHKKTEDFKEAGRAFVEKRKPVFHGR